MFLHLLIYPSSFCNNDQPEFLIDLEKFQPLEEILGSSPLGFCFCFESNSCIDTMVKMPPTTQKVMVISHKLDGIFENMLSGWIVMELIHTNGFNWWKSDFQNRV